MWVILRWCGCGLARQQRRWWVLGCAWRAPPHPVEVWVSKGYLWVRVCEVSKCSAMLHRRGCMFPQSILHSCVRLVQDGSVTYGTVYGNSTTVLPYLLAARQHARHALDGVPHHRAARALQYGTVRQYGKETYEVPACGHHGAAPRRT